MKPTSSRLSLIPSFAEAAALTLVLALEATGGCERVADDEGSAATAWSWRVSSLAESLCMSFNTAAICASVREFSARLVPYSLSKSTIQSITYTVIQNFSGQ